MPTTSGGSPRLASSTEFPIPHGPTVDREQTGITAGPDGNLWFTEASSDKIGRITRPAPLRSSLSLRPAAALIIAAGPDGNLWFAEQMATGSAGSPRPASSRSSRSPRPPPPSWYRGRPGRQPLVHRERQPDRPDHNGRRDHRVPGPHSLGSFSVVIAAGPDGNLWFTESAVPQQDRPDHDGPLRRQRHDSLPLPPAASRSRPTSRPGTDEMERLTPSR